MHRDALVDASVVSAAAWMARLSWRQLRRPRSDSGRGTASRRRASCLGRVPPATNCAAARATPAATSHSDPCCVCPARSAQTMRWLSMSVTFSATTSLARQSGAIRHRQRRLVLQVARRRDQASRLLATQYDRQLVRHPHRSHLADQVATVERDLEEEFQAGDRRIDRHGRRTMIDHVQLVTPQVFDRDGVRRAANKAGQLAYGAKTSWSCVFGDSLHIRMSSIMRWRNGEMARDDASMALLLSRSEAACLVPQHKQFSSSRPANAARIEGSTTTARAV